MNGSTKHNGKTDISCLLGKRRRILEDILASQEAFWLMLKSENFQQIGDMLLTTDRALKKLNELDSQLKVQAGVIRAQHREEILSHKALLEKIGKNDQKIQESLQNKKNNLADALKNINREQALHNAYSQNIKREGNNKSQKEIQG